MIAQYTNALTNFLHASLLLTYTAIGLRLYQKDPLKFPGAAVCLLFSLCISKMFGILVHLPYIVAQPNLHFGCETGSVLALMIMVITIINAIKPNKILAGLIYAILSALAIAYLATLQFFFISLGMGLVLTLFAAHTSGILKRGIVMMLGATIAWIIMRQTTNWLLQTELPVAYRFDNDIFHLLLMLGTYWFFQGIRRGEWPAVPGD